MVLTVIVGARVIEERVAVVRIVGQVAFRRARRPARWGCALVVRSAPRSLIGVPAAPGAGKQAAGSDTPIGCPEQWSSSAPVTAPPTGPTAALTSSEDEQLAPERTNRADSTREAPRRFIEISEIRKLLKGTPRSERTSERGRVGLRTARVQRKSSVRQLAACRRQGAKISLYGGAPQVIQSTIACRSARLSGEPAGGIEQVTSCPTMLVVRILLWL